MVINSRTPLTDGEDIDVRSALKKIIADMERAIATRNSATLGTLSIRALDAANEAAYVYERGVIQQIAEQANSTASKSKSMANDQLISSAERLLAEVDSDTPNLLSRAKKLAESLEADNRPAAKEALRLVSCGQRAEEALLRTSEYMEAQNYREMLESLRELSELLETGLGLVKMYQFKVCLLGEGGVGKTSLIRRFAFNVFTDEYSQTMGTKLTRKDLTLPAPGGRGVCRVRLLIWDIIGHRKLHKLAQVHFSGAQGAIAVCDLGRPETYSAIESWLSKFFESAGNVPVVVVGNKRDRIGHLVSEQEVERLSLVYGGRYFLTSAKNGDDVEGLFTTLAKAMIESSQK